MAVKYKSIPSMPELIYMYKRLFVGGGDSVQGHEVRVLMYLGTRDQESSVERYINRLLHEIQEKC